MTARLHGDGDRQAQLPPSGPLDAPRAGCAAGNRAGAQPGPTAIDVAAAASAASGDARSALCAAASSWQRAHWASGLHRGASAAASVPLTYHGSSACTARCSSVSSGKMRAITAVPGSPVSSARSRRRPWKTRVFTVSTGQSMIWRSRRTAGRGSRSGRDAALFARKASRARISAARVSPGSAAARARPVARQLVGSPRLDGLVLPAQGLHAVR